MKIWKHNTAWKKAVALSLCTLTLLFCSCASTDAPVADGIPLLESDQTELLPARKTKVTFRSSAKNCAIFLNGEYQGNTILSLNELAEGLYHLHAEKPGYESADYMVEIRAGYHEFYYIELSPLENTSVIEK